MAPQAAPLTAKVLWQVEQYICDNASSMSGFTMDKPTSGDKYIAWAIAKHTQGTDDAIEPTEWDIIATKRYMLAMGYLKATGQFGSYTTYIVKKEHRS